MGKAKHAAIAVVTSVLALAAVRAAPPSHVDITWMSVTNVLFDFGSFRVLADGYITRVPQNAFYGGGGGLARTTQPFTSDVPAVTRVFKALGGRSSVNVLLTGHSHVDHSLDTPTWSKLTGARIIGSKTTCFQTMAARVPPARCTPVYGGETISLLNGVTMRVVRWNHSGSPAVNPEQHNPVELEAEPIPDPRTGGFRVGVAEDFPNGGGTRAFLFVVDGPAGRFSWFYQNSGSPIDLDVPIVMERTNYGAPIDNLKKALTDAGLDSVDLWIGSGGLPMARLVLPVLKPKAYLPVHWDDFWARFEAGVTRPYSDPALEAFLESSGVALVKPAQYFDKWRLDRGGIRSIPNGSIKRTLGF